MCVILSSRRWIAVRPTLRVILSQSTRLTLPHNCHPHWPALYAALPEISTDELRLDANLRMYIADEMNNLRISVDGAREIERQKDGLIDRVEARLQQEIEEENLFTVRWNLV